MSARSAHARLYAGFRHRLLALLSWLPPEERRAEVERLFELARERATRSGLPPARVLFEVHEEARRRAPTAVEPEAAAPPSFLCDPSLGGLARWLRAAGYEAAAAADVPLHRCPTRRCAVASCC